MLQSPQLGHALCTSPASPGETCRSQLAGHNQVLSKKVDPGLFGNTGATFKLQYPGLKNTELRNYILQKLNL